MITSLTLIKQRNSFLLLKGLLFFVLLPTFALAQIFDPSEDAKSQPSSVEEAEKPKAEDSQDIFIPKTASQSASLNVVEKRQNNLNNIQIKHVIPTDTQQKDDESIIVLYMKNFKISQTLSGFINCSMRFYLKSTLPTRISNLSFRLKWPDMETPLSFDGVEPNGLLYQDYVLLGEGCYNMDKTPNIIVNRCRVKDMTQQACASKIHWVQ